MIASLAVLTVVVLGAATHSDTTINVRPGTRLELNNFAGEIAVETWAKNAVRIEAQHSSRAAIRVDADGPTLSIKIAHWRGVPTTVDYRLTVPKWMALELSGVNTEIHVLGSQGEVGVQSVQGEVSVTGAATRVTAGSVEGGVRVTGARGKVECSSVNAGVEVQRVAGPVAATSVNGEIVLEGIDSDDVEASTINGEVIYNGAIKDGGSYRFSTHNGNVVVSVPERTNATVSVATFSGEFSSSFPVQLSETRHGKRFNFSLGNGSARIELESFQGEIQLRRPGDPDGKTDFDYQYQYEKLKQKEKQKQKQKQKHGNSGDEAEEDGRP